MLSAKKLSKRLLLVLFATMWLAGLYLLPTTLLAAGTNINVSVCPPAPYPPPTITEPADGVTTEEASVLMTGEATPEVTIYAYRNDVQVGYVTAGGDGVFNISISLDVGTNILKASTNNSCSGPTFSDTVTIMREAIELPPDPDPGGGEEDPTDTPDEPGGLQPGGVPGTGGQPGQNKPPSGQSPSQLSRPVILGPRHGAKVSNPHILVVGEASANTNVRILRNDLVMAEVLSDAEGRFTVGITLAHGKNRLVAMTGQGADALSSKSVMVTYEPVSVGLTDRGPVVQGALIAAGAVAGGVVAAYFFVSHPAFSSHIWHVLKRWKII